MVEEESEKAGLKLNIQKTKIMAFGSITSWQIDGKTIETVTDFIFLGSKISVDGDCSHEIIRCLLLGRKAMTNLDSILKNRGITLPTKVHRVKVMVFPVVMYGDEMVLVVLVTKSCPTLVTPWTVARQAPLSMGFYWQEYWSGLPFPSPRNLPDPGIEPWSPVLQADCLQTKLQGKSFDHKES